MVPYPSKGRGRTSPSAALPISALQRARARNSACKESSRRERHSTDAYSDSDQSAQPRERASIYRLFSALLAKEPSAEFLAQAANLAPTVQGELGEYFASLCGCDIEQARADAASDFAALLLNMSPNPVIAYESVYTSEEGLLMQDARRRAALPRRAPACMDARFLPQPARTRAMRTLSGPRELAFAIPRARAGRLQPLAQGTRRGKTTGQRKPAGARRGGASASP